MLAEKLCRKISRIELVTLACKILGLMFETAPGCFDFSLHYLFSLFIVYFVHRKYLQKNRSDRNCNAGRKYFQKTQLDEGLPSMKSMSSCDTNYADDDRTFNSGMQSTWSNVSIFTNVLLYFGLKE